MGNSPAIGARKTEYPDMKLRNVSASDKIFHGTITQQETIAEMMQPRLMLMYFGAMTHRSLAAEIELPVMFVPT